MIPTFQFQSLINIGRINPIICIICVFFTTFPFGSVLKQLFDDLFHITFGYTQPLNSIIGTVHKKSISYYQLTTKNFNCQRVSKASIVGTGLTFCNFETICYSFQKLLLNTLNFGFNFDLYVLVYCGTSNQYNKITGPFQNIFFKKIAYAS